MAVLRKSSVHRGRGRPRLYVSNAAKQAAYRERNRHLSVDTAAEQELAIIQHALRQRELADRCWELQCLIDDCTYDSDMPVRAPYHGRARLTNGEMGSVALPRSADKTRKKRKSKRADPCPVELLGYAAEARVPRYRRALQRLSALQKGARQRP